MLINLTRFELGAILDSLEDSVFELEESNINSKELLFMRQLKNKVEDAYKDS